MIKEEAIEILSDMRAEYNIFSDDEEEATRYHALSWAIQALNEKPPIKAEPQRAYEQGVKDTLDKYDETCRIASEIRMAVGCKTAKECWELIRNGEIQRVKHGRWEWKHHEFVCSECKAISLRAKHNYCPNCGARMKEGDAE